MSIIIGSSRSIPELVKKQLKSQKPMIILLMLERLGYKADIALNGLEVLRALETKPYDFSAHGYSDAQNGWT